MRSGLRCLTVLLTLAATLVAAAGSAQAAGDCRAGTAATHPKACAKVIEGALARACYAAAVVGGNLPKRQAGMAHTCLPLDDYRGADILVLGEVHDNTAHHALRAAMIERFANAKQGRAAVVMEHVRAPQAASLAAYQAGVDRTKPMFWVAAAAGLGGALAWDKSGWKPWPMFAPMAEAAFRSGIPIYAGDVARAEIRGVARNGLSALPADRLKTLALDAALPTALHDALLTQLEASHCGLMPKSAFGTMADAQRLRDATLAAASVAAARKHGSAILLTGNGHARTDRGAPWYISRLAPKLAVVAVVFVEARGDATGTAPADLLPRAPDGTPAADALVLTGRVDRPDPCVAMRARFKKRP